MAEKDLWPTRYALTLRYVGEFITEFFEQNPISQLGIIGMREKLAVRVSDMSGNPSDHISNLQILQTEEPKGSPSLQNALDLARAALLWVSHLCLIASLIPSSHAPAHGTREILIICGSLHSADSEDLLQTIDLLATAKITCSVIGLAAQVAVFNTLVSRTNPTLPISKTYSVALNEVHYRELLMRSTTPPATLTSDDPTDAAESANKSSLLMMGFPSRIVDSELKDCACHNRSSRSGYHCSRCGTKVCSLPITCPSCKLTLILSTHLARSYHHLFPLQNWTEVSWQRASRSNQHACFGCQTPFPAKRSGTGTSDLLSVPTNKTKSRITSFTPSKDKPLASSGPSANATHTGDGVSESGRYECATCHQFFCIDCDVFAHEIVHNCPGCQSREGILLAEKQEGAELEAELDRMIVD